MFVTALKHLISLHYITIPRAQLKSWLKELIQRCFSNKNGEQRNQYLVIGRDKYYFIKSRSKANKKSKQNVIIQIWDFDDWKLFIHFDGLVFQQTIGISIGMNCVPLLAILLRHAYEVCFFQGFLKDKNSAKL